MSFHLFRVLLLLDLLGFLSSLHLHTKLCKHRLALCQVLLQNDLDFAISKTLRDALDTLDSLTVDLDLVSLVAPYGHPVLHRLSQAHLAEPHPHVVLPRQ